MAVLVRIENLDTEMTALVKEFVKRNSDLVAAKINGLPQKFLTAAIAEYFQHLKVRSGFLRRSFESVLTKIDDDDWELGLKSDMEYARIQHEGGTTPPREIVPRFKKALWWPGAAHPVKSVQHPGSTIRPKPYFKNPITRESEKMLQELKKEIGFA